MPNNAFTFRRKSLPAAMLLNTLYPYPVQHVKLADGLAAGADVAYVDEGPEQAQAPAQDPIVFVHGLSSYLPVWTNQLAHFVHTRRVIALDLPGYGFSNAGSTPPETAYTLSYYAEVVAGLLQSLGVHSCTLVGHSMGGQIALVFALRYPYKVSKLVLAAPAGFEKYSPAERKIATQQFKNFPVMSINGIRAVNRAMGRTASSFAEESILFRSPTLQYNHVLARSINGMLNEPVYDYLPEVRQPTLALFGEDDALIPNRLLHKQTTRQVAEQAVAHMPNARLVMLPHTGHFLQYENPAAFNAAVDAFLAS
jgi:pimeloyl-ACP methyl ester carboxylesterase